MSRQFKTTAKELLNQKTFVVLHAYCTAPPVKFFEAFFENFFVFFPFFLDLTPFFSELGVKGRNFCLLKKQRRFKFNYKKTANAVLNHLT